MMRSRPTSRRIKPSRRVWKVEVGQRVRAAMDTTAPKMSNQELGEILGVGNVFNCDWESGRDWMIAA